MTLVDEAGLELVDIDVELPKPGVAWGLLSSLEHWRVAPRRRRATTSTSSTTVHRARRRGDDEPARRACSDKAIRRRHELLLASAAVFVEVDLLLTPTTPTTAFAAEGMLAGTVDGAARWT